MTNRNEDRIPGLKVPVSDPIPQQSSFGGLDFTAPTEFVELPSKGKYYLEGHPLHGKDTIEIRFMTTKDEDVLSSKALLRKGVAIERFLQNIVIDKSIKIDDLLVGDKNALILAARITGYGAEYETNVTCPNCNKVTKFRFNLDEVKVEEGDFKTTDVKLTSKNTVLIVLPKTRWQVEVKFLTGSDEKWLSTYAENKKKNKLAETPLTDLMKRIIVSINDIDDSSQIIKAIDIMPAIDSKYLRAIYKKISPNTDLTQKFVCESCEIEQEVTIPLGVEFFWPER